MIAAPDHNSPQPGSLITEINVSTSFPGLDRVGNRLARGLCGFFADLGLLGVSGDCGQTSISTFGAMRLDLPVASVFIQFQLDPIRGGAMLIVPRSLISKSVDIFYGGNGETERGDHALTAAEFRFAERMGRVCLPLFESAWSGLAEISATFVAANADAADTAFVSDPDPILLQPLTVGSAQFPAEPIICVYPVSGLRSLPSLMQTERTMPAQLPDPVWRDKLTDAVMKVQLPVRSIFARPEISLARLMTLRAGDIIPVCLPDNLPMTVAGRLFAHGTVGEAGGRAAIRIEKIAEGNQHNE
jgi:flagellar motor switch protein FliM